MTATSEVHVPTLLEACDDPRIFGVELTPKQRSIMATIEEGSLLHVLALGRRSGKTLIGALLALWTCTLRPELRQHVRRRERIYAVSVATNLRQAKIFVDQAKSIVEGSPFLTSIVENMTDDRINFKLGSALAAFACTSRGGRGWPIALLLLDEAAHQLDTEGNQAAEPIFRALVPSTAQFGQDARVVVASSPFGVDGFFHDLFRQVESGELGDARCLQASTVEMRPNISLEALELEKRRDPEGYRSEYLAEFVPAGGAFMDASRIGEAVTRRNELAPGELLDPQAATDLAFESDSSGLVIIGRDRNDPSKLRLGVARSWVPKPGAPLSFTAVLDEIADICHEYGVSSIATDQFNAASAREHLERRRLHPTVVPTTPHSKSAMFADLRQRIYENKLELFDHPELLAELRRIETVTTPGSANIRIRRLGSSHGDLATALALGCSRFRDDVGPGYKRGDGFARRAPGDVRPGSQFARSTRVRLDQSRGGLPF